MVVRDSRKECFLLASLNERKHLSRFAFFSPYSPHKKVGSKKYENQNVQRTWVLKAPVIKAAWTWTKFAAIAGRLQNFQIQATPAVYWIHDTSVLIDWRRACYGNCLVIEIYKAWSLFICLLANCWPPTRQRSWMALATTVSGLRSEWVNEASWFRLCLRCVFSRFSNFLYYQRKNPGSLV